MTCHNLVTDIMHQFPQSNMSQHGCFPDRNHVERLPVISFAYHTTRILLLQDSQSRIVSFSSESQLDELHHKTPGK